MLTYLGTTNCEPQLGFTCSSAVIHVSNGREKPC